MVLTPASTATEWLYAAQLSAAIVLEKKVYVDGGKVRRSVGELPLRVLVLLLVLTRMLNLKAGDLLAQCLLRCCRGVAVA